MHREINPQLFQQPNVSTPTGKPVSPRIEEELKELRALVYQIKTQNQVLERKVEQSTVQQQELTNKYVQLAGKMNERKVSDVKIEGLIDRHNSLIMNFENRITHLSRIINEQELKLHNATAALEDARQEIARLRSHRQF
jgi:chromosome segregation ATPase